MKIRNKKKKGNSVKRCIYSVRIIRGNLEGTPEISSTHSRNTEILRGFCVFERNFFL